MFTSFALSLAVLAGMQWLLGWAGFQPALGVSHGTLPTHWLIAVLAGAAGFFFPLTPLTSLLSRRHEYQADAFDARHTSPAELIAALVACAATTPPR